MHSIRKIGIHSDKLSSNKQAVEVFKVEFEQFLQEEEISYEQFYSTNELGLFWKCLQTQTLAFKSEWQALEHKYSK